MINRIHKTLLSLLKKNYIVEFYTDNNFTIILSFYHVNSPYGGLCYISKEHEHERVDFQHHAKNKTVEKQLLYLGKNIRKLYKLNQFELVKNTLASYKTDHPVL